MIPITKKQREIEKQKIIDGMAYSWDRQPGEPEKAFTLFLRYLAIGRTRNYIKVSNVCEVNYQTICNYANNYSWKIRADEHDLAKDEEFKVKLDEEILVSRIRQQRIGKDLQELAARGIEMLNENIEELSPQDVAKLIDVGVKIERLALNNSTEISESKVESKVEVKVKVEEIPKEIAEKIGKELAIMSSEKLNE